MRKVSPYDTRMGAAIVALQWRKLKREDGRGVLGSRVYRVPEASGTFVAGEELARHDLWNDNGQTSIEHISHNGTREQWLCYHGHDRHLATQRALELFDGR